MVVSVEALISPEDERAHYDSYGIGQDFTEEFRPEDFFNFFSDNASKQRFNEQPDQKATPRKKGGKTEDAHIEFPITLEELYKGKVVKFTSHRDKLCSQCQGTGGKLRAKSRTCPKCEGSGSMKKLRNLAPGIVTNAYVDCTSCKARGFLYREKDKCKHCAGAGITDETKILEAYFPRGAQDGHKVVLEGEADEAYGKTPGSVIIEVHQQPHDTFERKNNDLYATIQISLAEAISGFSRVVLQHLDGRGIRVSTHSGTVIRPNEIIRIPQEGMPIPRTDAAGDLYLYVDIEFPKNGWTRETSELRKISNILPTPPSISPDFKMPENQIDDVDFSICTRDKVSVVMMRVFTLTNLVSYLNIPKTTKKALLIQLQMGVKLNNFNITLHNCFSSKLIDLHHEIIFRISLFSLGVFESTLFFEGKMLAYFHSFYIRISNSKGDRDYYRIRLFY